MNFRFLVLVLLACTFAGCTDKRPSPQAVAEQFFQQCATGQTAAAYASTADLFQLTRSLQYFEARVREMQLDKATVQWSPPEPAGDAVRAHGTFSLPKGGPLKLFATLVKSRGGWQVLEVREEQADTKRGGADIFEVGFRNDDLVQEKTKSLTDPLSAAVVPNEKQLKLLVNQTMTTFNEGIQKNDFTDFFNSTAERWRFRGKSPEVLNYPGDDPRRRAASDPENREDRLTMGKIKAEFQKFVTQKVNLSPVLGKNIIFDAPPEVSSEGVLSLVGHYEDYLFVVVQTGGIPEPFNVNFRVEFFFESSAWKLFGFHPSISDPKLKQPANP